MKKVWETPRILVQEFEANEYVAACYRIKCETPNNNGWYNRVYEDSNNNGVLDNSDKLVFSYYKNSGFQGCGNWHGGVIQDNPPVANGFVTKAWGRYSDDTDVRPVFVWKETFGGKTVDVHVMVPGSENYEERPNAS